MHFMGLDIGTSGSKCTLFNEDGTAVSAGFCAYSSINPAPNQYELEPLTVLNAVYDALKESLNGITCDKLSIAASSFGETFVLLDENDMPLGNAILCSDIRGTDELNLFLEKIGASQIMQRTGLPAHPMYSLVKLLWIQRHQPEQLKKAKKLLLFEDYIGYMLTGEAVCDYSLAARTMAFNIHTKQWDEEILKAAGIESSLFAKTAPSGTIVGTVKKQIIEKLSLPQNTIVATGGHDQSCVALGAGAVTSGIAIDGIGSSECISTPFLVEPDNELLRKSNYNCGLHAYPDTFLSLAFTFSGCSLINWFASQLAQGVKQEAADSGKTIYRYLDDHAPDQPTGIFVLPHFAGAGTPTMNTDATGIIAGLTLGTDMLTIYRGVLEGITYEMRYNLEKLKTMGIQNKVLRVAGGGAKSDLWLQIKADILGIPLERLEYAEAGTLGAAICAAVAGGVYTSFPEAVNALVKVKQTFYPNENNVKRYHVLYQKYLKLQDMSHTFYEA